MLNRPVGATPYFGSAYSSSRRKQVASLVSQNHRTFHQMSKKDFNLRRRIPIERKTITDTPLPIPLPSSFSRPRHMPNSPERINDLRKSLSEPSLRKPDAAVSEQEETEAQVLFRPGTCGDIFEYRSQTRVTKGYNKDARVLVNVTVQGSPGPIRALVNLGASVQETINVVLDKYREEGRTPHLEKHSASTCQLHHSPFSLESLSRSEVIGNLGSRSFYLHRHGNDAETEHPFSCSPEISSPLSFPIFISRSLKNFIRKSQCFRKIFGCLLASS